MLNCFDHNPARLSLCRDNSGIWKKKVLSPFRSSFSGSHRRAARGLVQFTIASISAEPSSSCRAALVATNAGAIHCSRSASMKGSAGQRKIVTHNCANLHITRGRTCVSDLRGKTSEKARTIFHLPKETLLSCATLAASTNKGIVKQLAQKSRVGLNAPCPQHGEQTRAPRKKVADHNTIETAPAAPQR